VPHCHSGKFLVISSKAEVSPYHVAHSFQQEFPDSELNVTQWMNQPLHWQAMLHALKTYINMYRDQSFITGGICVKHQQMVYCNYARGDLFVFHNVCALRHAKFYFCAGKSMGLGPKTVKKIASWQHFCLTQATPLGNFDKICMIYRRPLWWHSQNVVTAGILETKL